MLWTQTKPEKHEPGVALTGDPDYRIVMEAYPFVTRKIISDDSPALQRALRDILYRYIVKAHANIVCTRSVVCIAKIWQER